MEIPEFLSDEEKTAIEVLIAGGFMAFTEAKIDNVRELGTGLRRRTFRNRGKYQLVLACRDLANRQPLGSTPETTTEPDATTGPKEKTTELKPVSEMTKAELLDEAKGYEAITGEYKMDKAELAEAVQAARDKLAEGTEETA
jgi:hypothetical protein